MKKLMIAILVIAMLVSFSVPVLADGTMESLYTDEEIASQLRESEDDIVITLYYGSYMWGFSNRMDVDDILEMEEEIYMRISPEGEFYYHGYIEGKLVQLAYVPHYDFREFYKYAASPELVFDADVEVLDAYCLMGLNKYRGGMFIYFKTNNGDYALYKVSAEDEEMYLLPLEELYKLADAVQAEVKAHSPIVDERPVSDGGMIDIHEVFDLSPYRFREGKKEARWGLYVTLSVLAVAGAGAVCLIAYRKKKS